MKVIYSPNAKRGLDKHADYLRELKKSNTKKYSHVNIKYANDTLKHNITHAIDDKDEHNSSIFPDKYEYGNSNYKMHIDRKSHYVVFYKIIKTKKGTEYASIEKCIHSVELKKELEEKNIKPLKSADPKLLLDYTTIEKEDKVKADELSDQEREDYKKEEELKDRIEAKNKKKSKLKSKSADKEDDNDNEGEEAEITDPDMGEKVKKKKHKGERGGYYYLNDEGTRIYPPEWNKHQKKNESKSLNSLSDYIAESINFVSLSDYIKQHISTKSN